MRIICGSVAEPGLFGDGSPEGLIASRVAGVAIKTVAYQDDISREGVRAALYRPCKTKNFPLLTAQARRIL
jgi:hypothetical protein